jgi:hypothetical protein
MPDLGDQLTFRGGGADLAFRFLLSCEERYPERPRRRVPHRTPDGSPDRNDPSDLLYRLMTWAGLATPEMIVQELLRFGPQVPTAGLGRSQAGLGSP